jgi:farnesyl diphosphate synthase
VNFEAQLRATGEEIGAAIAATIAQLPESEISHAMAHATNGGKRLRGYLVCESAGLFGVPREVSVQAAVAIECLHAYSLVHDDLPAMDNDDLRRGQPTVHVKWDDATAILAGDALQTLAFETLGNLDASGDVQVELVVRLARASGAAGMVLGQAQDIAAETAGRRLSLAEITKLQANKTGALIRWSAEAGAVLGASDPAPLTRYATALGLAFQIADDLLDVIGDEAQTGKRVGKDADAGKATFVDHLGVEGARARAQELVEEAVSALNQFDAGADGLRAAAQFVVTRSF